jgi:hypothetical protein
MLDETSFLGGMLHLGRLKWKGKFKRATGMLHDQIALLAPLSEGRGQQENNRYSPKPKPNNAENEEKNEANRNPISP